jgi:hypothetical protein
MPVACHSEVCVQHAPVVEVEELMLAATFDAVNPGADQRPQSRRGNTSSKARMQSTGANDDPPLHRRAKRANRRFDLGKLWHDSSSLAMQE